VGLLHARARAQLSEATFQPGEAPSQLDEGSMRPNTASIAEMVSAWGKVVCLLSPGVRARFSP
jgi:hypothetical protein